MAKRYEVKWTQAAEADLQEIIQYIATQSVENAFAVLDKIKIQAFDLQQFPEKGRVVPELQAYGISLYRELIVKPWRIIYRVTERDVFVMVVVDSRRNVEDVLLRRLLR